MTLNDFNAKHSHCGFRTNNSNILFRHIIKKQLKVLFRRYIGLCYDLLIFGYVIFYTNKTLIYQISQSLTLISVSQ